MSKKVKYHRQQDHSHCIAFTYFKEWCQHSYGRGYCKDHQSVDTCEKQNNDWEKCNHRIAQQWVIHVRELAVDPVTYVDRREVREYCSKWDCTEEKKHWRCIWFNASNQSVNDNHRPVPWLTDDCKGHQCKDSVTSFCISLNYFWFLRFLNKSYDFSEYSWEYNWFELSINRFDSAQLLKANKIHTS